MGFALIRLRDNEVTTVKIANNAITTGKIANGAIINEDINATAAIELTKLASGLKKIAQGTYTGDSTVNKAVAHTLGVIPKFVIILNTTNEAGTFYNVAGTLIGQFYNNLGYAVTGFDTTNFYVGNATSYANSMNYTGRAYMWIAFW